MGSIVVCSVTEGAELYCYVGIFCAYRRKGKRAKINLVNPIDPVKNIPSSVSSSIAPHIRDRLDGKYSSNVFHATTRIHHNPIP